MKVGDSERPMAASVRRLGLVLELGRVVEAPSSRSRSWGWRWKWKCR